MGNRDAVIAKPQDLSGRRFVENTNFNKTTVNNEIDSKLPWLNRSSPRHLQHAVDALSRVLAGGDGIESKGN